MKRRNATLRRLEADLREGKPQPPERLVDEVIQRTEAQAPKRRRSAPRLGPALALSAACAATVIAIGGVGAPVDGAKGIFGFDAAGQKQPAADQYEQKVTICHRPPGNPSNAQTLRVGQSAVAAHLQNHPDSMGPCP